jgi:perosamine synthetase
MRIPVHRPCIGPEELRAVERVFESRWLGSGAVTKDFEQTLSRFLGVRHVIAVNTGTAALHMALYGLGIGPGDEVVVPSMTFISTVQAILAVGARPVFCEVQIDTLNIDEGDAARRLSPRTKAILPVHYGGRICDMAALRSLTQGREIYLVEDAAHAFGSTWNGRAAGTFGEVGCFSFDPIKNITCGGGGALATDDDSIASRVRAASNVGIDRDSWSRIDTGKPWFYEVADSGFRYQLSDINASIGMAQFKRLEEFRERKRFILQSYERAFRHIPELRMVAAAEAGVFPFNCVVRVLNGSRDLLMTALKEIGIGTTVQFIPCHLQPLGAKFREGLPVTERLFDEIVTLPLYFEMTDQEVQEVISAIRTFFDEGRR